MKISWHKYVRHHDVPAWAAVGWVATDALLGTGHGDYSTFMTWGREGEPIYPAADEEKAA